MYKYGSLVIQRNIYTYIICFHLKIAMGGGHHYLHYINEDTNYSERFIKLPEVTQLVNG